MNGSAIFDSQPSMLFGASYQPVWKATLNNLTDRRRAIEVHNSRVVGKPYLNLTGSRKGCP
jgi:hypothetical protein